MTWLRRLRGMLGVGLTWGTLWGAIGGAIGLAIQIVSPGSSIFVQPVVGWALGFGAYGVVSGFGFAALLSAGERSKRLRELSLKRVALWGVLGSALVPLAFGALGFFDATTTVLDVLGAIGLTGALGGSFASGSVAIARRAALAEPDEVDLLEGS